LARSESKNALVTGAASGLGRALALRLGRDGWNVAVADVDAEGAAETVAKIGEATPSKAHGEALDVTDLQQWRELRQRLGQRWEHLDLLVNNAGICGAGKIGAMPIDELKRIVDVNLHGTIFGCCEMVDWLKTNPGGAHIINTASIAAFASAASMGAYSVSKAGVVALSETLFSELKPHGVGVTVLCPGFFASNLLQRGHWTETRDCEVAQRFVDRARFTADDIADLAIKAMNRKQLYVVHGLRARLVWRLKRWMPRTFFRLLSVVHERALAAADRASQLDANQEIG
jgi:NAD(P)-dependent dehydrogenase (short-subunit alcohol dehydrogenase family)